MQAEASAKVSDLLEQAKAALASGDIAKAEAVLDEADKVGGASNRKLVQRLSDQIRNSQDPSWVFESLMRIPEDKFELFRDGGTPPPSLDLGYPVLTDRAVALALPQIDAAKTRRDEAKQQAQRAEEAARQAREERIIADRIRAEEKLETERKRAQEKAAADQAAQQAAQRAVRDKLDAYLAIINTSDVKVIESVSAQQIGGRWEATLVVRDIWHIRHYQLRLQDAQTLWEVWALIASPSEPDSARIKLVDGHGNTVGGSRIWGGSLIWVQEK